MQVKPPRTVFVNFPMGNAFGHPSDNRMQRRILLDALEAVETVTVGGTLIDLPYEWDEDFGVNFGSGYGAGNSAS